MEIEYSNRDVEKWKIGRVIPRTRRRRRKKKVVVNDMEKDEKKKIVEKDTAKVEFVKVDIRTPQRRKSQLIQKGKVKFSKLLYQFLRSRLRRGPRTAGTAARSQKWVT